MPFLYLRLVFVCVCCVFLDVTKDVIAQQKCEAFSFTVHCYLFSFSWHDSNTGIWHIKKRKGVAILVCVWLHACWHLNLLLSKSRKKHAHHTHTPMNNEINAYRMRQVCVCASGQPWDNDTREQRNIFFWIFLFGFCLQRISADDAEFVQSKRLKQTQSWKMRRHHARTKWHSILATLKGIHLWSVCHYKNQLHVWCAESGCCEIIAAEKCRTLMLIDMPPTNGQRRYYIFRRLFVLFCSFSAIANENGFLTKTFDTELSWAFQQITNEPIDCTGGHVRK